MKFKNQIYYYEIGVPIKNTIENFGCMVFLKRQQFSVFSLKFIFTLVRLMAVFFHFFYQIHSRLMAKSQLVIGQKWEIMIDIIGTFWEIGARYRLKYIFFLSL